MKPYFFQLYLSNFPQQTQGQGQAMDQKAESNTVKKIMSPCDVEALKKCLEENKGDYVKCQSQIEAFKSSCSIKKPNPSQESAPPLNSGVFSDLWQSKLFTLNHNSHLGICFFIGFLVLYVIFAEYLDLKFWAIGFIFWFENFFSSEMGVTKSCEGQILLSELKLN